MSSVSQSSSPFLLFTHETDIYCLLHIYYLFGARCCVKGNTLVMAHISFFRCRLVLLAAFEIIDNYFQYAECRLRSHYSPLVTLIFVVIVTEMVKKRQPQ